jgi:class 3 adenylate cyclase
MVAIPAIRYARSGETHIAYQVVGGGSVDLVVILGYHLPIEALWEEPSCAEFFGTLGSFSRLILMDRRGVGMSDPISAHDPPTLEQWMHDVLAVMDAACSERASVFGWRGGSLPALFLATGHPERVQRLVLFHGCARVTWAPDHPWGMTPEEQQELTKVFASGEPGMPLDVAAPSRAGDPELAAWWLRATRRGGSPGAKLVMLRWLFGTDIRPLLGSVQPPTLVLARAGASDRTLRDSRQLSDAIPDAAYAEVPGRDDFPWIGDGAAVVAHMAEFLTGSRPAPPVQRVIATVLFTDIGGSTERAVALGDRRWAELLSAHHAVVREQLRLFGGREIDVAGDGFFATFDGPARAVECACAIRDAVRRIGLEIRAGVHTGEAEVAEGGLRGIVVHIGARVGASAHPGQVLVSRTVADLIAGSGIQLDDRGERPLKGVQGEWRLFEAIARPAPAEAPASLG